MVVCNTFLKKEDFKPITYQSRYNRGTIHYLMVKKTDRCLLNDVKVISSDFNQIAKHHTTNIITRYQHGVLTYCTTRHRGQLDTHCHRHI